MSYKIWVLWQFYYHQLLFVCRDELKRMICIPDPCCEGDTDVLNIQFAGKHK